MEWIWGGFSSLILCQVKTFQQNSGNGNGGLVLQIFSSIHHSLELLKIWTKMKEDINNFTFYDLNSIENHKFCLHQPIFTMKTKCKSLTVMFLMQ